MQRLTDIENEAVALISEECAEVGQICGKIQRHGLESSNPNTGISNKTSLAVELADVLISIDVLLKYGIVLQEDLDSAVRDKLAKINRYLHYVET